MEREKEIAKLVNVLRRAARMAMQSEWTGASQDAATFCVDQYNRVLSRLKEIDPGVAPIFDPLPAGSSLTVAGMACRQLAAYYEDEAGRSQHWGGGLGFSFDPESFKEFWVKAGRDMEDLGEFIRASIEEWARQRKHKGGGTETEK
jgi:hypothetical protein